VLIVYYRLTHRWQNVFLLIASYVFYSAWDYRFLSLILISTGVDYLVGLRAHAAREAGRSKVARRFLLLSVCTNLGILGFFKYYGFFVDSAQSLAGDLGLDFVAPSLTIVLPVGISFYTFQTMSYAIDVYRGKLAPTRNLVDFAVYVAFFPQLVAGPIERATHLIPQIQSPRAISLDDIREGLLLIGTGLIRKVVIADVAGTIADTYFSAPGKASSTQLLMAAYLYSMQIYGDFSGYSNIARGTARLMGFDLIRNFHHPYFAVSVADFWRRWHISLSTWLRDYLYIPLGGNRGSARRTQINLMLTMLLGGLWHGASWNFVIWGGLHGIYLVVHRFVRSHRRAQATKIGAIFGAFLTFHVVTLTWIPFRLTAFSDVAAYFEGLGRFDFSYDPILWSAVFFAVVLLLIDGPQAITNDEYVLARRWPGALAPAFGIVLIVVLLTSGGVQTPFIYFQF